MEISKQPLVSVIIPIYNGEQYVRSCLENILNQTYKNLEIIVVDDGSTDKSAEIAAQYPVKVIREKNSGSGAARNIGIDIAEGEYLHFMDVDDMINATFYEKLVFAMIETGVDVSCSEMINQRIKNQTHFFKKLKIYKSVAEKLKITYVGRIGYVWRYVYRTEFLKKNNIRFEEGRVVEDLMFSLSALFFADRLVVVPGAQYTYIYQQGSQLTIAGEDQQAKRDRDWQHAKMLRSKFAEKHGFKIPGVDNGKIGYLFWKFRNYYRI